MKLYTPKPLKSMNCPQCGYELPIYFNYTKLIECSSCRSTIFLGDEVAKVLGRASVLSPEPSLIKMHHPFFYKKHQYFPVGKIRYSYDRGFWEEWFLKRDDSQSWWLSIDEGDFVLEKEADSLTLGDFDLDNLRVGQFVGDLLISEMGRGVCEGFEGELPKQIKIGITHRYIHLSGEEAKLWTLEYDEFQSSRKLFQGEWIDPFLIKVA
jgi:hypothetical protein